MAKDDIDLQAIPIDEEPCEAPEKASVESGPGDSDDFGGGVQWVNPDTLPAGAPNVELGRHDESGALVGFDFGFSLPGNPTITGIEVSLSLTDDIPGEGSVSQLYLTKGVGQGASANMVSDYIINGASTLTVGEDGELWGTSWNADEIMNSGFGVVLHVERYTGNNPDITISVSDMNVKIYYQ